MSGASGNDETSRAIAQVPEYILRAIIRMGEPSVQMIERTLPAQHKKLAGAIHERLVGGSGTDSAEAVPDAAGQAASSDAAGPSTAGPSTAAASGSTASGAAQAPGTPVGWGTPTAGQKRETPQSPSSGPGAGAVSSEPVSPASPGTGAPGRPGAAADGAWGAASDASDGWGAVGGTGSAGAGTGAGAPGATPAPTGAAEDISAPPVAASPMAQRFLRRARAGGGAVPSLVNKADVLPFDNMMFDQYEHGAGSETDAPGIRVGLRGTGADAKIQVTWAQPSWVGPDDLVIYRVACSSRVVPRSPEAGELGLCTVGRAYEEPVPARTAFRHFQVWANVGRNEDEVLHSQPRLVGEDLCVLPVTGVRIVVSQGVVEGFWDRVDGYADVRVFADKASSAVPVDDPANLVVNADPAKGSFEHRSPVRGEAMRYAFKPTVEFRGRREVCPYAEPHEVFIPAVLEPVDLEAWSRIRVADEDRIHLAWYSPPAGLVRIYLSNRAPSASLSFEPVPVEALGRDDALAEGRVATEERRADGEQVDVQPMWPAEWDEVHITPVTIVDDRAAVGKTRVLQRVRPIEHAVLMERTDSQLITFEWPVGASMVKVEKAPTGSTDPADRTFLEELDETRYRRNGGVRLNLNPFGENVLLTPRSLHAGVETAAEPTHLRYRGLRQYMYTLTADRSQGLLVRVWCHEFDDRNPPRFQLVHHPDRFPLSLEDARDPGAGICRVRAIGATPDYARGEPSSELRPHVLPNHWDAATGESAWVVPFEELRGMRPGQYFRLFIVGEDGSFGSSAVGRHAEPEGPRRIVVDTMIGIWSLHQGFWSGM